MADTNHNSTESDDKSNPVGMAIAIAIGTFVLIVSIMLMANYAIGNRKLGDGNEKLNTPEAIAARISHPATLAVDPSKGPVAGMSAAPSVTAKPAAAAPIIAAAIPVAGATGAKAAGGEGTYKTACSACHSAGIAGAPKSGDKAAWAPRIAQGKETLYKHAVAGFQGKGGVMPAKGGNASLSDAEVKAAVDYMIALNK